MKTLMKVQIEPVYVEFIPDLHEMEERKVYISKEYRTSCHKCLCGCGELTVLPLHKDGWQLIEHEDGRISFTPSIGNYQYACKSHYIITKNIANFV